MIKSDATAGFISITEAATRTGIPATTLRGWCQRWPGLAQREPDRRSWLVDPDLLAEMAAAKQAGTLREPVVLQRQRRPKPAPQPRTTLTVAEAGALIGVTESRVLLYCDRIPGFARPRDTGRAWQIDPAMAAIVGAIRLAAGGNLPAGALVEETERRHRLLAGALAMLRRPECVAQLAAAAVERMKAVDQTVPRRRRTRPTAPAVGEVRHGQG